MKRFRVTFTRPPKVFYLRVPSIEEALEIAGILERVIVKRHPEAIGSTATIKPLKKGEV